MLVPIQPILVFLGNLALDMLVLAGLALLIFGGRVREVGKNLVRAIREFKDNDNRPQ